MSKWVSALALSFALAAGAALAQTAKDQSKRNYGIGR